MPRRSLPSQPKSAELTAEQKRAAISRLERRVPDLRAFDPNTVSDRGVESRQVFIVHGHDEGAREAVARFIERIGLLPIILNERPNKGRTLITKFIEEAEGAAYAVVLMTPDDFGAKAGESETRPRPRQNVVFEFGFSIGKFGPERVAALVKGNVERPSDFEGVVYIDLGDAGWKQQLGSELQAAGFKIDWNRVMRTG
jgi:predicted nucleotide-binding protein